VEHRFVRRLELSLKVAGAFTAVHVVAHHQHERVRKALVDIGEHLRELVLIGITRAAVSDDGEPECSGRLVRKRQVLGGDAGRKRGDECDDRERWSRCPHRSSSTHAIALSMKSTIRFAFASYKSRCLPTNRYCTSSGSFGKASRTSGGTVESGASFG